MLQDSINNVTGLLDTKKLKYEQQIREDCTELCRNAVKLAAERLYKQICDEIAVRLHNGESNISGKIYPGLRAVFAEFGCNDYGSYLYNSNAAEENFKNAGFCFTGGFTTEGMEPFYASVPLFDYSVRSEGDYEYISMKPKEKWPEFWRILKQMSDADHVMLHPCIVVRKKEDHYDRYCHLDMSRKPAETEEEMPGDICRGASLRYNCRIGWRNVKKTMNLRICIKYTYGR